MKYIPLDTPPDRCKNIIDVDGVITKINSSDSFLAAFTEILRRRDKTNPCWKNATFFLNFNDDSSDETHQEEKDIFLEASEIDYITAQDNASGLWAGVINPDNEDEVTFTYSGNDVVQNCLHMRRAFAEFIYNCLSKELGNKIRNELINLTVPKNKIHYDGPMVWLTLMNTLFSTNNGSAAFLSSMETCLTNMTIVDDNYLEYSLKIKNGLCLVPEMKKNHNGSKVINTICSQLETHNKRSFPLKTTTVIIVDNAFGHLQFDNNWEKFEMLHDALDWKAKTEQEKYPPDCYSFLSLNRPFQKGLRAYCLGLMVWTFQMTLLILMVLSVVYKKFSLSGDVDNPDRDVDMKDFVDWLASYTPSNATATVRGAQIVSLVTFLIFSDSTVKDIVNSFETMPKFSYWWCTILIPLLPGWTAFIVYFIFDIWELREHDPNPDTDYAIGVTFVLIMGLFAGFFAIATVVDFLLYKDFTHKRNERFSAWMVLSCYLRLLQGLVATYATLILITNSNSVMEIILNFSAINFISDLDDKAFDMAQEGTWGTRLETESNEIQQEGLPNFMHGYNKKNRCKIYWCMIIMVFVFILGFTVPTLRLQSHTTLWSTQTLRLEFLDTRLEPYSSCYNAKNVENFKRRIYSTNTTNSTDSASIGYCEDERRWFLFKNDSTVDPCQANETRLAYSSKTDFFDISTIYGQNWYYSGNAFDGNTPLDMYFVPFERGEVEDSCIKYNDGKCDTLMNEFTYKYDGGDCCGSTCLNSNICGSISEMRSVSYINVFNTPVEFGISFLNCTDPDMLPITVRLDNIIVTSDVSADLSITCDEVEFLSVSINEDMENKSETIMVPDGANCTISVRNTTSNDTELYVDYTVFHGDEESIIEDPIVIVEAYINTDTIMQVDFTRIPECYRNISPNDYLYPTRSFYPNCLEPEMVDITIRFDYFCNNSTYTLNCDGIKALVVDVDLSTVGKPKTVKIKDGSFCTLMIKNKFINAHESNITYNHTGYIGYTVYKSIGNDTVVILQDKRNAETISSSFQMIPSCFPNSNVYNENEPSYKASQFMINEGYSNCDDDTFYERYNIVFSNYDCRTIADIICAGADFSILCQQVKRVKGLEAALSVFNSSWTMFAPTNDAFDALDDDFNAFNNTSIEDITEKELKNFISFHLVHGVKIYRSDFSCFSTLYTMANGKDARLMCKDAGINGTANIEPFGAKGVGNTYASNFVSTSDITACNGVIHSIDQALLYTTKLERKENKNT